MAEPEREVTKRPAARRDMIEIAVSIGRRNPPAVEEFLEATEAAFERLAQWPEIGSRVEEFHDRRGLDLRRWDVPGFASYLIFYSPTQNGIIVHRVLHGARDLTPLLLEIEG